MTDVGIIFKREPEAELAKLLIRRLVAANDRVAPPENHEPVAVFATADGALIGGASGHTHWGWLFVSHLRVDDAHRRQGLGSKLMERIEQAGVERGARAAHLDTYDFQALGFYRKRGYEVFGQLEDYPVDHTRYFLRRGLITR